jgi:hypothetical protein
MSVTTKSHLMEDHAVQQKLELHGFGDLGEDFGERNHQDQAQADRRLGCIRIFIRECDIPPRGTDLIPLAYSL